MTREEARQEVENKKDAYTDSLKSFAKACQEKTDNAVLFGAVVEAHTRLLNTISNTITELHNEYNFFEDKNLCQEIEATVKNFLESSFNYCDLMDTVANKYKQQPVLPSEFAYNTIQTFLNTFSSLENKN